MPEPQWLYDRNDRDEIAEHEADRISTGVSKYDWYNLDAHLANVIIAGLERTIANRSGHPAELTDEEWDVILHKIVYGFDRYIKFELECFEGDETDPLSLADAWLAEKPAFDEAFTLLHKWFINLWD